MSASIRVVVAEDEPAFRTAIQRSLSLMPECQIVGVCKDGEEARELIKEEKPDVLLTDIVMPKVNGLELIRDAKEMQEDLAVVVLTINDDDETVFEAFRAGALGYLLKTSTPQDMVDAIRLAHRGEAKVTPKIATKLIEDFRTEKDDEETDDSDLYVLSDRETEILELIAKGMRNKEIATQLSIAEKTVKNHVSNILKALQVNSRTEAAMKAVKAKLVQGD